MLQGICEASCTAEGRTAAACQSWEAGPPACWLAASFRVSGSFLSCCCAVHRQMGLGLLIDLLRRGLTICLCAESSQLVEGPAVVCGSLSLRVACCERSSSKHEGVTSRCEQAGACPTAEGPASAHVHSGGPTENLACCNWPRQAFGRQQRQGQQQKATASCAAEAKPQGRCCQPAR